MARDPNDAWVQCRCGQRHWGLAGAAGLYLRDAATGTVALQLRAAHSHQGETWALPGGAIQTGEQPLAAALREAAEEAAIPAGAVTPLATYRLDHGDWAYTTVVAQVAGERPGLEALDGESAELRWVAEDALEEYALHPAFAAAAPALRSLAGLSPTLVVDAANVVGSRPDGWWRDRAGASERLLDQLIGLARRGFPGPWFHPQADAVWPTVAVVLEGQARTAHDPGHPGAEAATAPVIVFRAPGSGDDAIVDLVQALEEESARPVLLASADRGLLARVPGAVPLGPGTLRRTLDGD